MNQSWFCWLLYLLTKGYFFLLLWMLRNLWFNAHHHVQKNRRDWSDPLLSGCFCQRLSQSNLEMRWVWILWPLLPSVYHRLHISPFGCCCLVFRVWHVVLQDFSVILYHPHLSTVFAHMFAEGFHVIVFLPVIDYCCLLPSAMLVGQGRVLFCSGPDSILVRPYIPGYQW